MCSFAITKVSLVLAKSVPVADEAQGTTEKDERLVCAHLQDDENNLNYDWLEAFAYQF